MEKLNWEFMMKVLPLYREALWLTLRLGLCGTAQLQQIFAVPLSLTKVAEKDVVTYVYGLYSTVQDFAHLVPSLTMALGVAAVPALSGAYQDQSARFSSLYAGCLLYTSPSPRDTR